MNTVTTQHFLILNLLILGFFVVLFFWGRRGSRPPSNLRVTPPLNNPDANPEALNSKSSSMNSLDQNLALKLRGMETAESVFMYNGHSWNAYEVLGVTPESSIETIRAAFENSIQKTHEGSHDFLKSALATILNDLKSRGYKP